MRSESVLCLLLLLILDTAAAAQRDYVICLKSSSSLLDDLAHRWGFQSQGEVVPSTGCYHVIMNNRAGAKKRAKQMVEALSVDPRVDSVEKQGSNVRLKNAARLWQGERGFRRVTSNEINDSKDALISEKVARRLSAPLSDPFWKHMWYLKRKRELSMNIQGAWDKGVSGRGVTVTILDDGIEKDHPDLVENYDPLASTDINDNDSDPTPRYDKSDSNRHGTRCAGQVSKWSLPK